MSLTTYRSTQPQIQIQIWNDQNAKKDPVHNIAQISYEIYFSQVQKYEYYPTHTIAKARLRYEEELEGRGGRRRSDSAELSILTRQIRRSLSLLSARARCLLDRVHVLGSGGREVVDGGEEDAKGAED